MYLDDSDNEEVTYKNDMLNYKGYFVENGEEDEEPKIFEFGAHFPYKELYKALEELRKKQMVKELEKEKGNEAETNQIRQKYNKKIDNRERNNTKNKNIKNNNLDILKGLNQKIRSRNFGVSDQNENNNLNELTFVPVNYNINCLLNKKDKNQIKSISINKSNYLKLFSNKKTKNILKKNNELIGKQLNFKKSNKNISHDNNNNNIINKKFNKNKSNFNHQINKMPDKFIPSRNREQNYVYQQIYSPFNNITISQNNNKNNSKEINHFQSYQMQINKPNINNKIYKKMIVLNNSSFNNKLKEKTKENFQKKISQMTEQKFVCNSLNKNIILKHKKIRLDKKIKNSNSYIKGKIGASNLDNLLNSYNSKKNQFSSDKKIEGENPGTVGNYISPYKYNSVINHQHFISLKKFKLKENSNNMNFKFTSMNNKKHLSNNVITNKINKDIKKYDKQNIKQDSFMNLNTNNLVFQDVLNNNHNKTYLNSKKNIDIKFNSNKKSNQLNNKRINKTNSNINHLLDILDKNEKISRNKNNDDFINNISSNNINNTNKKIFNYINSNTNIKKMNLTQQNKDFNQYKNPKHQLRKKIFNYNKNRVFNNYKKIAIDILAISNKKIFTTTSNEEDDSIFKNNNYKSKFINKKLLSNKTNSNFNNEDKTIKRINLTKDIIKKPKIKINNIYKNNQIDKSLTNQDFSIDKNNNSKNINQLNNISNNSYLFKKYENLIDKKSQKKNININININNNNKIIYNKIVNNKSPLLKTNKNINKTHILKKIGSYNNKINQGKSDHIYNINIKNKRSPERINFNI